jgi:trans-o-hydroxybenzylidenepyruvate hydratase-aldolase
MGKRQSLLTAAEINGAWVILPSPAKEGADHWSAQNTVDLDETARMVDGMIAAGADGILTMGTLGEAATMTWEEKKGFISTVIESARGRIPVFAGTTTLNTRDTIAETRWAADVGIDGTMVGVPMWCAASVDTAVQFYKDLAEACPETAIAIYANFEAFKFEFGLGFWIRVSRIPQVVTAKLPPVSQLATMIELTGRRIRFLPIDNEYYASARMAPDFITAFWSSSASCGPQAAIALRDRVLAAKKSGDWEPARKLSNALAGAVAPIFPNGSFKEFSTYNIRLEKERMNEAGWLKAGPTRPPYQIVPEPYLEGARVSGRAWAKVCRDLASGEL